MKETEEGKGAWTPPVPMPLAKRLLSFTDGLQCRQVLRRERYPTPVVGIHNGCWCRCVFNAKCVSEFMGEGMR